MRAEIALLAVAVVMVAPGWGGDERAAATREGAEPGTRLFAPALEPAVASTRGATATSKALDSAKPLSLSSKFVTSLGLAAGMPPNERIWSLAIGVWPGVARRALALRIPRPPPAPATVPVG